MAINMNKYVDISTIWPSADVAERAFGGLVITAGEMTWPIPSGTLSSEEKRLKKLKEDYNAGLVVYLQLTDVYTLFGKKLDSNKALVGPEESSFAFGYYGYMSPSGRFASRLAFKKLLANQSPADALKAASEQPNIPGFGSVTVLSIADGGSSDDTPPSASALVELATLNAGAEIRGKYLVVVNLFGASDPIAVEQQFAEIRNVHCVMGADMCSAYMPMAILGATDFNNGTVTTYMFKQFPGETPAVSDDETYTSYASANINFYGCTQVNGQTLNFYQRGYNTDGNDTSICCNEMWFKSSCESQLMELLTSKERLPANDTGVAFVESTVTDVCLRAVRNGAFMSKETTAADVRTIAEIIAAEGGIYDDAERIAANIAINGYSVYAALKPKYNEAAVMGNVIKEYVIAYYVFYGTADSIRFIKGNDILI